jgi:prevent-host-death family protein
MFSAQTMKSRRVLPLTDARARLSGLVHDAESTLEPIGISVHGDVKAYLIGAEALARLEKAARAPGARAHRSSKLRGSLRILGDLDGASELIRAALERTAG